MRKAMLAFVLASLMTPVRSDACMNEVLRRDRAIDLVGRVERAVEERDWAAVEAIFSKRNLIFEPRELQERAYGLYAVAEMRRPGGRDARHLSWALEAVAKKSQADPLWQARLAEAQVKQGSATPATRVVLEDLDKRDLMAEADPYAALAKLRLAGGDFAGHDLAAARCAQRAGAAAKAVCPAPLGIKLEKRPTSDKASSS